MLHPLPAELLPLPAELLPLPADESLYLQPTAQCIYYSDTEAEHCFDVFWHLNRRQVVCSLHGTLYRLPEAITLSDVFHRLSVESYVVVIEWQYHLGIGHVLDTPIEHLSLHQIRLYKDDAVKAHYQASTL